MTDFPFRPTVEQLSDLRADVAPISDIQQQFRANDAAHLVVNDRVAHQYQIAGGKVLLRIESQLPDSLRGVGLFQPESGYTGIARISTGLGCPHNENLPDFLGIRLAFRTPTGRRVDFLGINDPASPTDTHFQFIKLLEATAGAAGSGFVPGDLKLLASLTRSLGLVQGGETFTHIVRQTLRTTLSTTAYQTYWTGIEETGGPPAKFVIDPVTDENPVRIGLHDDHHLTAEWRERQARGPIEFNLYWLSFIGHDATSLVRLTRGWQEDRHLVGHLTFPQCDHTTPDARLWAALAAEMGANPGNWVHDRDDTILQPATEFGVARKLAYERSQAGRDALPETAYASVFENGTIDPGLQDLLNVRRSQKRREGHIDAAPD
ncbi:MAG TPA: hypothetical protein VF742_08655 [Terracidiphilus sp.]